MGLNQSCPECPSTDLNACQADDGTTQSCEDMGCATTSAQNCTKTCNSLGTGYVLKGENTGIDNLNWPEADKTIIECKTICENQPGCTAWWSYADPSNTAEKGDCYVVTGDPNIQEQNDDIGKTRTVGQCSIGSCTSF